MFFPWAVSYTHLPEAWLIWGYGMCNTNMESAARQALEDVGDERAVYLPFMPPISEEAGEVGALSLIHI